MITKSQIKVFENFFVQKILHYIVHFLKKDCYFVRKVWGRRKYGRCNKSFLTHTRTHKKYKKKNIFKSLYLSFNYLCLCYCNKKEKCKTFFNSFHIIIFFAKDIDLCNRYNIRGYVKSQIKVFQENIYEIILIEFFFVDCAFFFKRII